jgi:hypothetical protein
MESVSRPIVSLRQTFESVPDPRRGRGKRHPLPVILALSTCAMLCGARSLYAIAQWGRDQEPAFLAQLGLTREKSPCVATLHRVFTKLDVKAFEQALGRWAEANLPKGERAIAVDGKTLRGIHGEELPGVVLVAAYAHSAGLVLGQRGGEGR